MLWQIRCEQSLFVKDERVVDLGKKIVRCWTNLSSFLLVTLCMLLIRDQSHTQIFTKINTGHLSTTLFSAYDCSL